MKKVIAWTDGRKTYIVAGFVAAATFAKMVGWITESEFQVFAGFLATAGLMTVRDAIRKTE